MDSGIPQVLQDGENGLLAPVGDCAGFALALQALWSDPQRRQVMADRAWRSVRQGGFRLEDMVEAYQAAFQRARADVVAGRWRRPRGRLCHAPASVAGVDLFPVPLPFDQPGVGDFASQDDAEDYLAQLAPPAETAGRSPPRDLALVQAMARQSLQGLPVFVAAAVWTDNGVNAWSAALVRALRGAGLDARLLLTEESTELVQVDAPRLPLPTDLPVQTLALRGTDSWGARWGAMRRTLDEAGPCVYIPNDDWRHACVLPALSDRVIVLGLLHDRGPLYREQALRLADCWNAVVVPDRAGARALLRACPELAARLHVIAADAPPARADGASGPTVLLLCSGIELPQAQDWLVGLARGLASLAVAPRCLAVGAAPALAAALAGAGVVLAQRPDRSQWQALCADSDIVVATGVDTPAWPMVLEAMANGCCPVVPGWPRPDALGGWWPQGHGGPDWAPWIAAVAGLLANVPDRTLAAGLAREQARGAGYSSPAMPDAFQILLRRCLAERELGLFRRPRGALRPPPAQVQGMSIFPVALPFERRGEGVFASRAEADAYRAEANSRSGAAAWRR
jgi:hypothetical protein